MPNSFKSLGILLLAFSLAIDSIPAAHAREEVKRSERWRLLKQATGKEDVSSSTSFSARVESTFAPTADPETSHAGRTDAAAEDLAAAEELAEEIEIETTPKKTADPDPGAEPTLEENDEDTKGPLGEKAKVDASDAAYQQKTDEFYKQVDQEREKMKKEAEKSLLQDESEPSNTRGGIPLSLANNPFYFGKDNKESFVSNRPVIVSRLLQQGYSRTHAESLVGESAEETILKLMQDEGLNYGAAVTVVKVSDES